jgi:uncharacterized protein (TIGR02246 family)
MSTAEDASLYFQRRVDAWLREDLEAYLDCWAEDMTFASPLHAQPLRGKPAYAALVRASAQHTRPLRFDVFHLAVVGDVVLAEWRIDVVHRPTGHEVGWDGMSRTRYRDGLIVEWREYWNPQQLAALTGG